MRGGNIDLTELLHHHRPDIGLLGVRVMHHWRLNFDSQYYAETRSREAESRQQAIDDMFEKLPLIVNDKAERHNAPLSQERAKALGPYFTPQILTSPPSPLD